MTSLRRAAAAAALLASVLPAPALAITNGTPDGAGHPAVGLLVADGGATPVCSGVLLGATTFVTAGHCLVGADASTLGVRFDVGYVPAVGGGVDPAYPKSSDVAVVRLAWTPAVAPARLAPLGVLDGSAGRGSLTAVGYGYYDRVTGGGPPQLLYDGVRRTASAPISTVQPAWVKLNSSSDGGVCFGDSGGPWLLDDAVAAIVSSGSGGCTGNSTASRIDTGAARAFLAPSLAP